MKNIIKKCYRAINLFGFDPLKTIRTIRGFPAFWSDYLALRAQLSQGDESCKLGPFYPCIEDRYSTGGQASGHYFHQDLLVASRIFVDNPRHHVDVGSRVDGFVAHVASFRKLSVIDIRPMVSITKNIEYLQADIMTDLPGELVEVAESVSCLHALEHFGLGRYGDPVRWDGHLRGFNNLARMLRVGGRLYLSVPIGEQRIEFNAHRVFSIRYLLNMLQSRLSIVDFSFVDDHGDLHESVFLDEKRIATNCNCRYGCAIFECIKDEIAT